MATRSLVRLQLAGLAAILLVGLAALAQQQPGRLHTNGFSARDVFFQKGEANIRFEERDHKISGEHHKSASTSEYIKIEATPPVGAAEREFVHYYYECPPAPLAAQMTARVHVKAYRPGVQAFARVVLPRERDPKNPDSPLTTLVAGEVYDKVRQWQPLGFGDPLDAFTKHLPVLHARLGRAVDGTDAYIDRIVLNVYAGPGITEVWVDDLEIGPIKPGADAGGVAGKGAGLARSAAPKGKVVPVEFSGGQILVGGDPFFMVGIRHSDTPLQVLRNAMFNTVWFPKETTPESLEDAIRAGFWIVPEVPLPETAYDAKGPKKPDPARIEKDAEAIARYLKRFQSGDAVLMWDFGNGRTTEDLPAVIRATEVIRANDPRRPRSVDLWDGFQAYSRYVNAVGAHRWPLFSSLELVWYKEWLRQRQLLVPPGKLFWTWVQNHLPDWYVTLLFGRPDVDQFPDPIGPHPEQIRILTYLSIAAGCRGLGYWSDKYLAKDTHFGKDRLLEIALLNAEIEMLKDVLAGATDPTQWLTTSDANVQAAVVRGPKELLIMPVWLGYATQHCPAPATLSALTIRIPNVPDGSIPWRITPAGVEQMQLVRKVAGATELTITEFDTAAAIVFTTDLGVTGKVVRWQDETRFRMGKTAAEWAQLEAIELFEKISVTHAKIVAAGGPEHLTTREHFDDAKRLIATAKVYYETNQWDLSYRESRRAMRPLRVLMRADWEKATESLEGTPTASPFAASYYSLPQHYAFAKEVACCRPSAGNGLAHGGFELSRAAPDEGAAVDSLPGWKKRESVLDPVVTYAGIINTDVKGVRDEPPKPPVYLPNRTSPQRVAPQPLTFRQPEYGQHCLKMEIKEKPNKKPDGTPADPSAVFERAILAVDSPQAEFAPGSLVRISFWAKVPFGVAGSADGLVVFDSVGGEPLGVRVYFQPVWRRFYLYRRVPPTGKVQLTFALTGAGIAYIDDVKIEPLVPVASLTAASATLSGAAPAAPSGNAVVPAGYPRR